MTKEELKRKAAAYRATRHRAQCVADDIENSFVAGAEWMQEQMIDKACEWLTKNYGHFDGRVEDFVSDFKKVMKGE